MSEGADAKTRAVVTVLGEDRVGIVARIATVLAETGTNIEDIRQAVLEGLFSMTMLVTVDEGATPFDEVQARLTAAGEELGLQVNLQREDVFRYMHRI
jgi:ACT domain-containing protein